MTPSLLQHEMLANVAHGSKRDPVARICDVRFTLEGRNGYVYEPAMAMGLAWNHTPKLDKRRPK
jgi:hypothetical protein